MPSLAVRLATLMVAWTLAIPLADALPLDDDDAPRARATVATGAIRIDGTLDDPGWRGAIWTEGFITRKPALGAKPPVRTRFAVVYDRSFLYVAVDCGEPDPAAIVARSTTRDSFAIFSDDAISLKLDPHHDQRTTVGLVLNPVGARLDYRGVNETSMRREWDAVWLGAAQRVAHGWGAEFRIAWSVLGVDPDDPPAAIGLNFSRDHASRNATYDWALMPPPYSPITASRYGHLVGLEQLAGLADEATSTSGDGDRDRGFQLRPWVLGEAARASGQNEARADLGLDLFVQRGRWRTQVTLNTDFAQADVDDTVANLGRFSLQMPEKRDFFLRDMERFAFGDGESFSAFYSRRIGLDAGSRIPIAGGLKIIGDTGNGLRLGAMDVVTLAAAGQPPTSHTVLRGQVELAGGSNLGAIVTHRQSVERLGDANTVVGVDGAWRGGRQPMLVQAFAAVSRTGGAAGRATQDLGAATGSDTQGGDVGGTAGVSANWRGRLVRPAFGWTWTSSGMRSDLGFVRRVGVHEGSAELVVEPRLSRFGLERLRLEASSGVVLDAESFSRLDTNAAVGFDLVWNAGWLVGAEVERLQETVQADFDAAGLAIPAGAYGMTRWLAGFETPSVRAASLWLDVEGRDYYGGDAHQLTGGVTLRPGTWLRLEARGTLARLRRLGAEAIVAVVNARASIGFSPDLNVDLYSGYDRRAARTPWLARLRWTWRRGSDVFFVVQGNVQRGGPLDVAGLCKLTWAWP